MKTSFKEVGNLVFPEFDNKIINFWKENSIFEKSIEQKNKSKIYSFYDGPPFITGLPHYGSLLSSISKDAVLRYWTMKGFRIRRVWGWDCHGLPAETAVEKLLGLKSKKDIEKIGVKKFIDSCRSFVSKTSSEWEWYVDHIGRWVDFKNAYKTMDTTYMETVLWVFKTLYDKGLIYKGKRVSLYCPRCATPLSKFEVTMDEGSYRDIEDPAITIKFLVADSGKGRFGLSDGEKIYVLAWTTTPWTLPSNFALAVDLNEKYSLIEDSGDYYILAEKRVSEFFGGRTKKLKEFKGSEIVGIEYKPLYSFFKKTENDYKIYPADFVTMEEGTGIVHIAPGFGEDDTKLGEEFNISSADSVDELGSLDDKIKPGGGMFIKKADPLIINDLKERGLLFKEDKIVHSYPFCYRCDSPLIYRSQEAWYVKIDLLRDQLLKTNEEIYWFPEHFKNGRFEYNLRVAPDWCISRTRYWGTPLPVWECECGERYIFGSIAEIEEASGQKVADLHKPEIDELTVNCKKCKKKAKRVREVLDCWMESGSMPYGEWHYPFEHEEEFKNGFPTDFISEYTGQLRAWFYYLHVLSNALMDSRCFNNVIVTGVVLGSDGKKMSKSKGNFPDPKGVIEKYGGDSLRLYLLGGQVMAGDDVIVTEREMAEKSRSILTTLWNSYRYFVVYASLRNWDKTKISRSDNILDRWIISLLNSFQKDIQIYFEHYNIPKAVELMTSFVDNLSRWYIRRSRDRFDAGEEGAFSTLYSVLVIFAKVIAPITPFLAEEIFKNLTEEESVHLVDYPIYEGDLIDADLEEKMVRIRKVCEMGHAKRKEEGIKVRQPLSKFKVQSSKFKVDDSLIELIKDELNVKQVEFVEGKGETEVSFDTQITPELKQEGEARDLIRQIQEARKNAGCGLSEKIKIGLPSWPESFEEEIKNKTFSQEIVKTKEVEVIRNV